MRVEHQLVNQSDPSTNQNVERTQLLKMLKIKICFVPLASKNCIKLSFNLILKQMALSTNQVQAPERAGQWESERQIV